MIKIGIHIPGPHDATCWYRASGPLSHIRKRFNRNYNFERLTEWSFSTVQMLDAAFFQRPSTGAELEAIRICKRLNVPVIADYDDLLFDIPTDNPAYRNYMNKAAQETIITIMREVDCLWVSTKELKRTLQIKEAPLNERVFVVPNALDDHHLVTGHRGLPPPPKRRQPAVVWRGSPTHERDVMEYAPEIAEVAKENPATSFVFVGYNPWFLTERMGAKQAIVSPALSVGEFMDFLYATASRIGVVPLHDSRFNRCKSNIAWLEMTWAGGTVLAPGWEEWLQPGVVNYKDQASFQAGLEFLVKSTPEELEKLNRASWNHIVKNFTLSATNATRIATIDALVMGTKWPDGWQRIPDPDTDGVMELE